MGLQHSPLGRAEGLELENGDCQGGPTAAAQHRQGSEDMAPGSSVLCAGKVGDNKRRLKQQRFGLAIRRNLQREARRAAEPVTRLQSRAAQSAPAGMEARVPLRSPGLALLRAAGRSPPRAPSRAAAPSTELARTSRPRQPLLRTPHQGPDFCHCTRPVFPLLCPWAHIRQAMPGAAQSRVSVGTVTSRRTHCARGPRSAHTAAVWPRAASLRGPGMANVCRRVSPRATAPGRSRLREDGARGRAGGCARGCTARAARRAPAPAPARGLLPAMTDFLNKARELKTIYA